MNVLQLTVFTPKIVAHFLREKCNFRSTAIYSAFCEIRDLIEKEDSAAAKYTAFD